MRLIPVWLHVLGVVVWVGGVAWQAHVLAPLARAGDARTFAAAARRARPITWIAVSLVALTGFYNVTQLGALETVMQTGAGLALAGKFILVLIAVAVSAQRDFTHVTRLMIATTPEDAASSLRTITRLDRVVLVLAVAMMYLGVFVSRNHA